MQQRFFSKKQPHSDPTWRAQGFTVVRNIYDICPTAYARSHSPIGYSVVERLTLIHSVFFFSCIWSILNVLCQPVEMKSWGFAMYWRVDEHSEDKSTLATVNIELLWIKC